MSPSLKSVIKLVKSLMLSACISSFMKPLQKWQIMKAFINSQFGYDTLHCVFCSRRLNNRINRIQERPLRIVGHDKSSKSSKELLEKDNTGG